jgi:hypothetical protein
MCLARWSRIDARRLRTVEEMIVVGLTIPQSLLLRANEVSP